MKIIGRSENGYIIDASRNEIANLIGFYSDCGRSFDNQNIGIGCEINVHDMYHQLYDIANAHDDIEKAKERLKNCIDILDLVNPVININIKRE